MTSRPQTPAEFDAAELAVMQELGRAQDAVEQVIAAAHRQAGDVRSYNGYGRNRVVSWQLTDDEAIGQSGMTEQLARAEYAVKILAEQITRCENFYRANPWTRWYPCLNADGHVHSSSRACPTLHRSGQETSMGWETSLSGQPVEKVIEVLGPRLCSVCFPDAPAEHCRSLSDINRAGREAERAARQEAKYAKQLRPEEQFRTSGDRRYSERIETVAKCKELLRREVELRDYYGRGEHPDHASSVTDAQTAAYVLLTREGIQAGTGATQEQIDKVIANAVKSNIKNGARLNKDGSLAR